tara:strand:- start:779 stop:1168 length:390 start_codon:yes stop_codon:yes gene_type:complete
MFSEKELILDETELREQVALLSEEQRAAYQHCEQAALRRPSTYVALNTLFFLGAHHFYLRRWLRGLSSLALGIAAATLLLGGQVLYGFAVLLALAIVDIPQLLNYEHLVHARNNNSMRQCLIRVKKSLR